MPIALKQIEFEHQFREYASVLIVPCNVCPKMCLAAESGQPYIDLFPGSGKDAFAEYLSNIRETLEKNGKRVGIFKPSVISPMMCLWPRLQRERLARVSRNYESIAVIGCESAMATARNAVRLPAEAVVQIMRNEGIANFVAHFNPPFTIEFKASPGGIVPWPMKTI